LKTSEETVSASSQSNQLIDALKIVGEAPIAPIALATRPDEQSVTVKNFAALALTKRGKGF
jgi:hypothetical protein